MGRAIAVAQDHPSLKVLDQRVAATGTAGVVVGVEVEGTVGRGLGQVDLFPGLAVVQADRHVGVHEAVTKRGVRDTELGSVDEDVDLHDDEKINFKDFAVLADTWLDEQLWPAQ